MKEQKSVPMRTDGESWWQTQKRRIGSQPNAAAKIGKAIGIFLFDEDKWDDMSEAMEDYMREPGISKAEKMDRINQVSSVFRKFDGRSDVYSKEQIANARLTESATFKKILRETLIEDEEFHKNAKMIGATLAEDNLAEFMQEVADMKSVGPKNKYRIMKLLQLAFTNGAQYIECGMTSKDAREVADAADRKTRVTP